MGQPVSVIEKQSSKPGVVRFSTNRVISGTGHDRFTSVDQAVGPTPAAEVARRIFARGDIGAVHINGSVITVTLARGDSAGIAEIIGDMYTYYTPGVEPPKDEDLIAQVE